MKVMLDSPPELPPMPSFFDDRSAMVAHSLVLFLLLLTLLPLPAPSNLVTLSYWMRFISVVFFVTEGILIARVARNVTGEGKKAFLTALHQCFILGGIGLLFFAWIFEYLGDWTSLSSIKADSSTTMDTASVQPSLIHQWISTVMSWHVQVLIVWISVALQALLGWCSNHDVHHDSGTSVTITITRLLLLRSRVPSAWRPVLRQIHGLGGKLVFTVMCIDLGLFAFNERAMLIYGVLIVLVIEVGIIALWVVVQWNLR
jgi:hypothetical protein